MALLIDGYNLLHVTGIIGRSGTLQGSREALLAIPRRGDRPEGSTAHDDRLRRRCSIPYSSLKAAAISSYKTGRVEMIESA